MFDSVRHRGNIPGRRFGAGAVITVLVHVGLLAVVVWLSTRAPEEKELEPEVKFFAAQPPPPPPPPPPAGGSSKPKTEKKIEKKPKKNEIVQPKEIPQDKPKEAEPEPESEKEAVEGGQVGGVEGGVAGGVVGGQIGGVIGGTIGGTLGADVLAFGEGMTRPTPLPGNEAPQYTREAREARIEGVMLLKCIITTEGTLRNCRVIKPLPHMEKAVLEVMATWKFTPVMYQGRAVSVEYVIPVRLVMPR